MSEPLPASARARLLAEARDGLLAPARDDRLAEAGAALGGEAPLAGAGSPADGPAPLDRAPRDPEALLFGRYRLLREIGRGGMGVVHEAEDVALRRRVALKRLVLPPRAGPGLAEQVLREARAAARLDHPNIAAVFDVHDDAIALQFVDGRPLSEVPRPEPRRLVAWMRDAARAVHHAHEHGIVHRDLKPHNLMVAGERLVVTDFGLAKELAVDGSLSLSGSVVGTPAYMPPEQAGGRARDVDARSDVYGLGATLYDRLAGRPPFVGKDLVALLRAVGEDDPPPLRTLAPDVPRDLALVVHKCLEKDKARRYASAAELADDLERWLDGRPVLARAPTLGYRLGKLVRRHGLALAAASALLLVALAAVAWNWVVRQEHAAKERTHAATEEALALVERLAVLLEDAQAFGSGESQRQAHQRLDEGIALCRDFLGRHAAHQIEAKLGRLLRERGRHDEALAAFDRALALQPADATAHLERGLLRSLLAGERVAAGERSAALDALREQALVDLAVIDAEGGALTYVDRLRGRAERARLQGRWDDAQRHYDDVARLAPHVDTLPALAALALARGDPDEAFRQAMSAVDLGRGFLPAYAARNEPQGTEESVARAIRQHQRAAAGRDGWVEIEGIAGRFTDWASRLQERTSTAGAYAFRALGEVRVAARSLAAARPEDALVALDRAAADLGNALTIEPQLAPALGDRGLVEQERARLLSLLGRAEEAALARARARADLVRALELLPGAAGLAEGWALSLARDEESP